MSWAPQEAAKSSFDGSAGIMSGADRSTSEHSPSSSRKWSWGTGRWMSLSGSKQLKGFGRSANPISENSPRPYLGHDGPSPQEFNCRQLQDCVQKLKAVPLDAGHVDEACETYSTLRDRSRALCEALVESRPPSRYASLSRNSLVGENGRPGSLEASDLKRYSAVSSSSLESSAELPEDIPYERQLEVVRDWKACLETLVGTLRLSLLNLYKEYEPSATATDAQRLLVEKSFRRSVVHRMRHATVPQRHSAEDGLLSKYEFRFRDFDIIKNDLGETQDLLHAGESGISPSRPIEDIVISSKGDSILEFANTVGEERPVLRFRVSSHFLAESSQYFAQIFTLDSTSSPPYDAAATLPPPPTPYSCKDGSEVQLYRLPHVEVNQEKSLEILLHAAHLHHERIPREISFDRFVAIAEVCKRYQCTSPLELVVEHRWLPQWMHKATDDKPDGLLLISYVFGLRRLFTRMSKTAILNVVDTNDLQSKPWPQQIKDKVWAVRTAKMDQVYACCSNALQEYLRPPSLPYSLDVPKTGTGLVPTSTPRCPKGSHFCDAASLGWLMMLFAELQLLPHIMRSPAMSHLPTPPQRSLNQILDSLRFVVSPPQAHRGVCDYAPAFRGAVNDIYNSISGLTLFDIAAQHGWALSKDKRHLPQAVLRIGVLVPDLIAHKRDREEVALRIMRNVDDLEDLYSIALVNKCFFETYNKNQLELLKELLLKSGEPRRWTMDGAPTRKSPRRELEGLKKRDRSQTLTQGQGNIPLKGVTVDSRAFLGGGESRNYEGGDGSATGDDEEEILVELERTEISMKMTREEAEQILWPENIAEQEQEQEQEPAEPHNVPEETGSGVTGSTEKFRADDFSILEDKTLVTIENKNLREVHDQKTGLLGTDGNVEWI